MGLPLKYHWRSLFVRRTTTLLTLGVVAAVVAVFAWMIGLAGALARSLAVASDERVLVVLKRGATAESNSAIPVDEYGRLSQLSQVARAENGDDPLQSPEMLVQIALPRLRDGGRTTANVAVRGVTPAAFAVHRAVRLVEGRMFSSAEPEVIVGLAARRQFAGMNPGDSLNLGYGSNRTYRVVGCFSAGGGPLESEIWGYLPSLMNSYNRQMYSSANLLLRPDADPAAAVREVEGPAIQLTAKTERDYWQEQAGNIRRYLGVAYALVGVMCVAAVFSIANTMFSFVAGRTQEIAMLRTLGYSRRQILAGFLLEAMMLALLGGVAGCLACAAWLALSGNTKDMFGSTTFTVMAFEIRLTPLIVIGSLLMVAAVGALGALTPALRAARLPVVDALREA